MRIGERIYEIMKQKGMTQKEFAEKNSILERTAISCIHRSCE